MFGYIYKITNLVNSKIYIGKHQATSFDDGYWGSGKLINRAYKKYGRNNFTMVLVEECNSREELNAMEKHYISLYNSKFPNGYNIASGGDGGDIYSALSEDKKEALRFASSIRQRDVCKQNHPTKGKHAYNNGKTVIYLRDGEQIPDGFVAGKGECWKHIPWNKGLSKEVDERVRKYGMKGSKKIKGKIPWNKGLTKDINESLRKTSNTLMNHEVSDITKRKISDRMNLLVMMTDGVKNRRVPKNDINLQNELLSIGWVYGKAKTGIDRKLYNSVVIRCVETGTIYNSLSSAGRDLKGKISIPTIRKILDSGVKYNGLSFVTIKN